MYYKSVSAIAGGGKTAVLLNTFSKGLARCSGSNWVFFPDPNWLCAPGANKITLEDYLKENPDKTEHDFAELKALSDQIYYEQDRAESAQTRKDVSIHGLEETEHCATRALDEEWEERVVDIQNRKYAWKALEQLFTVGALTEVQKRRFRLHVFQGLSTRQIGRMEGTSHQAVAKSINLAIAKLKKYFAAQG